MQQLPSNKNAQSGILRAVLKEIIVTVETPVGCTLVLHWQGGDHTRLEVLKNRSRPKSLQDR